MSSLSTGLSIRYGRIRKLQRFMSGAVLQIDSGAQITVNSGGKQRFVPRANPGTCTQGEIGVDVAGKLNICSATNTWTVVGTQT